jgi:hypothetical protein
MTKFILGEIPPVYGIIPFASPLQVQKHCEVRFFYQMGTLLVPVEACLRLLRTGPLGSPAALGPPPPHTPRQPLGGIPRPIAGPLCGSLQQPRPVG